MKIIKSKILLSDVISQYLTSFPEMVKVDVDIERKIIAIDAELHADLEVLLLEQGSKQENIWGINLYPFKKKEDFVEYTSLINIRPSQNNFSMEVQSPEIQKKIDVIVEELIDFES